MIDYDGDRAGEARTYNLELHKQMLAWCYRHIRQISAIRTDDERVFWPSATWEFMTAAERLVPDIKERAEETPEHADMLVPR